MTLFYEDVAVGDALPALTHAPITHNRLVRYSGASGDFNPLHTDREWAQTAGYDNVIAHGMLVMGFVGRTITDYVGPAALQQFKVRFTGITRIGDSITCEGRIAQRHDDGDGGIIHCELQAVDQCGDVKVTGTCMARLPKRHSKQDTT